MPQPTAYPHPHQMEVNQDERPRRTHQRPSRGQRVPNDGLGGPFAPGEEVSRQAEGPIRLQRHVEGVPVDSWALRRLEDRVAQCRDLVFWERDQELDALLRAEHEGPLERMTWRYSLDRRTDRQALPDSPTVGTLMWQYEVGAAALWTEACTWAQDLYGRVRGHLAHLLSREEGAARGRVDELEVANWIMLRAMWGRVAVPQIPYQRQSVPPPASATGRVLDSGDETGSIDTPPGFQPENPEWQDTHVDCPASCSCRIEIRRMRTKLLRTEGKLEEALCWMDRLVSRVEELERVTTGHTVWITAEAQNRWDQGEEGEETPVEPEQESKPPLPRAFSAPAAAGDIPPPEVPLEPRQHKRARVDPELFSTPQPSSVGERPPKAAREEEVPLTYGGGASSSSGATTKVRAATTSGGGAEPVVEALEKMFGRIQHKPRNLLPKPHFDTTNPTVDKWIDFALKWPIWWEGENAPATHKHTYLLGCLHGPTQKRWTDALIQRGPDPANPVTFEEIWRDLAQTWGQDVSNYQRELLEKLVIPSGDKLNIMSWAAFQTEWKVISDRIQLEDSPLDSQTELSILKLKLPAAVIDQIGRQETDQRVRHFWGRVKGLAPGLDRNPVARQKLRKFLEQASGQKVKAIEERTVQGVTWYAFDCHRQDELEAAVEYLSKALLHFEVGPMVAKTWQYQVDVPEAMQMVTEYVQKKHNNAQVRANADRDLFARHPKPKPKVVRNVTDVKPPKVVPAKEATPIEKGVIDRVGGSSVGGTSWLPSCTKCKSMGLPAVFSNSHDTSRHRHCATCYKDKRDPLVVCSHDTDRHGAGKGGGKGGGSGSKVGSGKPKGPGRPDPKNLCRHCGAPGWTRDHKCKK